VKNIKKTFEKETSDLKSMLSEIKELCNGFDKTNPEGELITSFVERLLKKYSNKIDIHFFNIFESIKTFSEEEYSEHQKYYQKELVPFFRISPYNKRVYEKPLGYPGDYIMMLYLYDNGYEGDTTFAKFIHRYSMNVPTAKANHNRRLFYKSQIEKTISKIDAPKITSIACGPAVEVIEALKNTNGANKASFICLDFEKRALEHVSNEIKKLEDTNSTKYNVKFINADVRDLLKIEKINGLFEDQDLIYSSGLIDYFSDKISSKMIGLLFKKLKRGGMLIVGNVSEGDKFIAYTEFLGGWELNRRSKDTMLKLAEKITEDKEVTIELEKETGMNLFMSIRKV